MWFYYSEYTEKKVSKVTANAELQIQYLDGSPGVYFKRSASSKVHWTPPIPCPSKSKVGDFIISWHFRLVYVSEYNSSVLLYYFIFIRTQIFIKNSTFWKVKLLIHDYIYIFLLKKNFFSYQCPYIPKITKPYLF